MSYEENIYAKIVSGEISADEIQKLKSTGEWDEIQKILKATDELQLPSYNKEKGYQDLITQRSSKTQATKTRSLLPRIMSIAASVILLLGAYFVFTQNSDSTINASYAENKQFNLPDNSSITLNDGSSVLYNKNDWSDERKVTLTGEALFDVESGSAFEVVTQNGKVQVLGTSFNVRSWDNNLYVECYRGKVKVTDNKNQQILTQGQSINIAQGTMQTLKTISHQKPLWSTGTSRFHGESLSSVFSELERQFDVEIEFPKDNRPFSGTFRHNDLEQALSDVCNPMNLNFDFLGTKKIRISTK